MRVLIATIQVPFVRGGAEILAEGLRDTIRAAGHEVELVTVPFKWYPAERVLDHMLACRLLDLSSVSGSPVDRLIGLKFPAYLIPHPNKVLWLVHQHRTAYELWDHPLGDLIRFPNGMQVRDAIRRADTQLIPEARAIYTIAGNVSKRLKRFCGIDSTPLYNPPQYAERFYCADAEDYLYFPSRLSQIKRQWLVLEALAKTRQPVRVRFAGAADYSPYAGEMEGLARDLQVSDRVEWLGLVNAEEMRRQYAHSIAVVYPPTDEDYGYVTLEAMLAGKPIITCADAGGPLEFVVAEKTGLIAQPTPEHLAAAMDRIWKDRARAKTLGEAGRERYETLDISWAKVVERLLA